MEGELARVVEAQGCAPAGEEVAGVAGDDGEAELVVFGQEGRVQFEGAAVGEGNFVAREGVGFDGVAAGHAADFGGLGEDDFGDATQTGVDEAAGGGGDGFLGPADSFVDGGPRRDAVQEHHRAGGGDEGGLDAGLQAAPGAAQCAAAEVADGVPAADGGVDQCVGECAVAIIEAGDVGGTLGEVGEAEGVLEVAGEGGVPGGGGRERARGRGDETGRRAVEAVVGFDMAGRGIVAGAFALQR